MRVVFDVNVLVRVVLRSQGISRVLNRAIDSDCTILTSDLILNEFASTVRKPRLGKHVDWNIYNGLVGFLSLAGESVQIQPPFPICRDPDDGYLLAMAASGKATHLVTLDQDLLCLSRTGECVILTPGEFEKLLAVYD